MKRELAAVLTASAILSSMVGHVNAQTRYVTLLVGMSYRFSDSKNDYEKKTITYDKYGLLKKESFKSTDESYSFRYVYDSHHHIWKSTAHEGNGINTYKTNKDGMVIHSEGPDYTSYEGEGTDYTYNKNNQVIKEKVKGKTLCLYKYNKKGQLIAEGGPKELKKNKGYYYRYNKYGYMSRYSENLDVICKYKYTKDHRVKKRKYYTDGDQTSADIWTYRYKKVKINTKYMKQVRYQQDALTLKNGHFVPYIYRK